MVRAMLWTSDRKRLGRVLVVDRASLVVGSEARRVERALIEQPDEILRAGLPLHDFADDRRDDPVVERIELTGRELRRGLDVERVFRNHFGAMPMR